VNYLTRLIGATRYSWAGIKAAARSEPAFQTELLLLPIVIVIAIYLGETTLEQALLIVSWLFIMVVELLNSAIEAVVDRIGSEQHELSGQAKDLGSAAVLTALIITGIIWLVILLN